MSNIEWTEKTWNPVIGCTPVSAGCLNCYAATMANRLQAMPNAKDYQPRQPSIDETIEGVERSIRIAEVRGGRAVFTGEVRCLEHRLAEPLKWRKPCKVFVDSMSDLFHEAVPAAFIHRVLAVCAATPQHVYQILTKRPERMAQIMGNPETFALVAKAAVAMGLGFARVKLGGPLPNVWLGTSVESDDQHKRAWDLLKCPAAVRFLSCEPLIGRVDLNKWELLCKTWRRGATIGTYIDWVIVGGESGPNARPCNVEWIRAVVQQCKAEGVPCFVKQLGAYVLDPVAGGPDYEEWPTETLHDQEREAGGWRMRLRDRKGGDMSEWPEDLRVREMPASSAQRGARA